MRTLWKVCVFSLHFLCISDTLSLSLALSFSRSPLSLLFLPLFLFPDFRCHLRCCCWICRALNVFHMSFCLSLFHINLNTMFHQHQHRHLYLRRVSCSKIFPLLCYFPAALSVALSVFPCGCHKIGPQIPPTWCNCGHKLRKTGGMFDTAENTRHYIYEEEDKHSTTGRK